MSLSKYLVVQQIIMGAIMTLAVLLVWGGVPAPLKRSRLHDSSRMLGLAAMVLPIASFIYYFGGFADSNPQYATAMNLSAYCLTFTFLTLAFYILLGRTNESFMIKAHLIIGVIYPFPLWFGICSDSEFIAKHTLIAFYTLFVIVAIIHIAFNIYFYFHELNAVPEKRSKQRDIELQLQGETIYAYLVLVIISFLSPSFFYYPLWLGMVFIISFVVGAVYIYLCYRKAFVQSFKLLIETNANTPNVVVHKENNVEAEDKNFKAIPLKDEVKRGIRKNLQVWIAEKGFLESDLTIDKVAKATYTNRTYLSKYINAAYHYPFKTWLILLRIEEVKKILQEHPERSISSISAQMGFSSPESFSHVFTHYEQMSPTKWRDKNRKKISKLRRSL